MRLLAAVLLAAIFSPAFAQPVPTADDQEAAKAHFMAGSAYYEQANYADAVKEFNEAYRLSQRPDLLYNLSRSYEQLELWQPAIDSLKKYLSDKPDAGDRGLIQARIDNLTKRRDAQPPRRHPPPPVVTPSVAAPPPRKHRHVASLIVGGIGVAALIASIGTGVRALDVKHDVDGVCKNQLCPTSERGQVDEGRRLAVSTDVLIGVGAAAVLTGVVLLVVETRF